MSSLLFTWIVYHDRAPLTTPKELGTVQAPDIVVARAEAAKQWLERPLLVQSAASARVRPVSAIPLDVAANRQTRVAPKKRGKYSKSKQQLDAFCAAKRAAHERAKRDVSPTMPSYAERKQRATLTRTDR